MNFTWSWKKKFPNNIAKIFPSEQDDYIWEPLNYVRVRMQSHTSVEILGDAQKWFSRLVLPILKDSVEARLFS